MFQKLRKLLRSVPKDNLLAATTLVDQLPQKAMPDHAFWYIVDRAGARTKERTYAALWHQLSSSETEDVVSFAIALIEKKKILATNQTWAASRLLTKSIDTLGFSSFLNWIVSNGVHCFELMKTNADDLAKFLEPNQFGQTHFDDYSKVPAEVWREKTGRDPWEDNFAQFPPVRDAKTFEVSYVPSPNEAEFLSLEFPQLWEMFGSQAFPGHKSKKKVSRTEPSPSNTLH